MLRPKAMIALAFVLAALAAGSGYLYLYRAEARMANTQDGLVVVAKQQIPAKTLVTPDAVALVRMPTTYIHPHAARSLDQVVGAVTSEPIISGEEVLLDRLVQKGDTSAGFPYLVPPGMRAVTVAVDDVAAVGWHLQVGDHVDILGTIDIPLPNGTQTITTVVLQDVDVLALGDDSKANQDTGTDKNLDVNTVTLAVTLEEAMPLVLADEKGKIRMALRHPIDNARSVATPFDIKDFQQPR